MKAQSWVGSIIGRRYQIEDLLGQGGMSAVYRAYDPNLRRVVAIKLIHAHLASDPNFVGRFKEEAAAVARLRHPNIVQVHDFNIDDGTYYMVMEYLAGETLQTRLRRLNDAQRLMPFPEAIDICSQLCNAVGYAHNHELIHRDIKPANIMLDVNGRAILMDFGIVKIIGGDYHTATGATIGTAMYMSPEQIRTERVDDRSDIYSLGVTLYEMVSGQPPYKADSAMTLMMMVLNDPLPDLCKVRSGLPQNLLDAVNKALAKEPAERFQTMAEMATSLQTVQENLESMHTATTATDEVENQPEVMPAIAATIKDTVPDLGKAEIPATEVDAEGIEFEQPQETELDSITIEEQPGQTSAGMPQPAVKNDTATSRLKSRQIIGAVIGILFLLVLATGGYLYVNSSRTPGISLTPINRSMVPVNAKTAPAVVNQGVWQTDSFIEALAYSPDSTLIGTANNREEARFSQHRFYSGLWEIAKGHIQSYQLGHSQWVYDVAFSADGQLFASASDDGTINLWQSNDGSIVNKLDSPFGSLSSVDFSPSNLLLAAGSWNGEVGLWELGNANLLRTLKDNDHGILDVAFSPDNQLLAAALEDKTILIWQVSDGGVVHTLQGHQAAVREVAFSPDGTLLTSASEDHTIGLWQVSDGSLLRTMQGHAEPVLTVAFSTDGSLLASGSSDGTLRLWQVSNGQLVSMLTEGSESITSVEFSPDSYFLVSAAADGEVQFWGISEAIPFEMEPTPHQQ
jgi:serine/threonine protein kinase